MLWKRGTTLLIGGIASISFGSTYTQNDLPGENCVDSRPSLCRMRRRVSDVCGSRLWRFRRDWSWRAEVSDWVARFMLDVPWIVYQRGWPYAESARASSWGTLGCWGFCSLVAGTWSWHRGDWCLGKLGKWDPLTLLGGGTPNRFGRRVFSLEWCGFLLLLCGGDLLSAVVAQGFSRCMDVCRSWVWLLGWWNLLCGRASL